jgi:hypothetical protein
MNSLRNIGSLAITALIAAGGCATHTETGAGVGSLIGAGTGALIGSQTGTPARVH